MDSGKDKGRKPRKESSDNHRHEERPAGDADDERKKKPSLFQFKVGMNKKYYVLDVRTSKNRKSKTRL